MTPRPPPRRHTTCTQRVVEPSGQVRRYGAVRVQLTRLIDDARGRGRVLPPDDVGPLVATVARLAELDGSRLEQEVLRSAEPRLEAPEYDNLDGGTYYHTLTLIIPVDLFARLGDQVRPIEERISNRISGVLRGPDRLHVTGVVIQPSLLTRMILPRFHVHQICE